jgi:GT2 family glycosyltransferase
MSLPPIMSAHSQPTDPLARKRLAVLMTCYNRRDKTLACLDALARQRAIEQVQIDVYLVDDGCTDGTGAAVRKQYPQVIVLEGDGNLYWCGGMRMAWAEAMKGDYDYYLWLNDDTVLFEDAVRVLLMTAKQTHEEKGKEGIVVGSCRVPETGEHSYGGSIRKERGRRVIPGEYPQSCDLINGNIVLIPRGVWKAVGNISPEFVHLGGDNDYGLRAKKAGFELWVAPGYQGLCAPHPYALWADPNVSLRQRWHHLRSPKGQRPYEVYVYARRHSGFFWPLDLLKLYFRVLFPRTWKKTKQLARRWMSL